LAVIVTKTCIGANVVLEHDLGRLQGVEEPLAIVGGVVGEWCRDGFVADYYARSPAPDPVWTEGVRDQVVRGGRFCGTTRMSRSSARTNETPCFRDFNIGVRPARRVE